MPGPRDPPALPTTSERGPQGARCAHCVRLRLAGASAVERPRDVRPGGGGDQLLEGVTALQTSDDGKVLTKTNFDDIYDQPDPRAYYRWLGSYDYAVPHYGKQMFRQVMDALPVANPTLVDLCCSYGVNSALLKHDLELSDLYEHYTSPEVAGLPVEELAALDREFYASVRSRWWTTTATWTSDATTPRR